MKKIYLLSAMVLAGLFANKAQAQISVHIGLNIPVRHVYVPAPQPEVIYNDDFDDSDDYYYLPEVEAYYSIPLQCYFYNDGGRWIRAQYLPGAYRNYDWRTARRFEVRGRRPYMNHDTYRGRWGGNPNRGDWNRRDNNYANRGNNNNGGWGRDNNRGGYGQPQRNGRNGYNQPDRNQGGDRGGWGGGQPSQPGRNQGGGRGGQNGQQPQQPSNGGWGSQNGGSQQQQPSQPSNNGGGQHGGGNRNGGGQRGGGQDRGNGGGGQVAQNNGGHMVRQSGFMRPARF
nr:hypothetical protein [uncultured Mucilaginibacter sp.]